MKVMIDGKEYEVSVAVADALNAQNARREAEAKVIKDGSVALEVEVKTLKDSNAALQKVVDSLEVEKKVDSIISQILILDENFSTTEKEPIALMRSVCGIEGHDDVYVQAYFDAYISSKIEIKNKEMLNDKDVGKDFKIPNKYYGGK